MRKNINLMLVLLLAIITGCSKDNDMLEAVVEVEQLEETSISSKGASYTAYQLVDEQGNVVILNTLAQIDRKLASYFNNPCQSYKVKEQTVTDGELVSLKLLYETANCVRWVSYMSYSQGYYDSTPFVYVSEGRWFEQEDKSIIVAPRRDYKYQYQGKTESHINPNVYRVGDDTDWSRIHFENIIDVITVSENEIIIKYSYEENGVTSKSTKYFHREGGDKISARIPLSKEHDLNGMFPNWFRFIWDDPVEDKHVQKLLKAASKGSSFLESVIGDEENPFYKAYNNAPVRIVNHLVDDSFFAIFQSGALHAYTDFSIAAESSWSWDVVVHEVAHSWDYSNYGFNNQEIKDYYNEAIISADENEPGVNGYYRTNAAEFYAQAVSYYFLDETNTLNPNWLPIPRSIYTDDFKCFISETIHVNNCE